MRWSYSGVCLHVTLKLPKSLSAGRSLKERNGCCRLCTADSAGVGEGAGGSWFRNPPSISPSLLLFATTKLQQTRYWEQENGSKGAGEKTLSLSCKLTEAPPPRPPRLSHDLGLCPHSSPFNRPHCPRNLFLLFLIRQSHLLSILWSDSSVLGPLDVFPASIPKQVAWTGLLS